MAWRFVTDRLNKAYIPVMPGAAAGTICSTDIGKLCMASSNHGLLAVDTGADYARAAGVIGIIAAVPADTTQGSTTPFYVAPITPGELVEADYSTAYENSTATVIATSNIGKFMPLAATTTPTAAGYLDPSLAGNAAGTTDGLIFKLLGFSTKNQTAWGVINSSHLAL